MSLIANNAVGWACLQISGGWKRIAWVCATIAVGVPLVMFGLTQLGGGNVKDTLAGLYVTLGIVQGGLFGIGLPSRVHAAMKRDRVGKLIESHRLMPTPARHAIAGYIVGANLLLLSCIATLFAIGLVISAPAGQDWRGWIAMHVAAGGLSAMFCCVVAFSSQWLPKFNPALFAFLLGPIIGAASASLLPPLRVLFTPYLGSGLLDLQRGEINGLHVVAMASQFLFSVILFIGACRRYRRDDVPALGFGWGFALLSLWIALTLIGVLMPDKQRGRLISSEESERVAYVVALSMSLLLGIGPIASAAAARLRWRERRAIDEYFHERQPIPLPIAATMVALVVSAVLLAAPRSVGALTTSRYGLEPTHAIHFALTGVQIVLFVATMAALARAAARLKVGPAILIVGWLFLIWVVPPGMDGLLTLIQGTYASFPHPFSAASTPFCLGMIWGDQPTPGAIGLAAQAGAVVVLMACWVVLKRSNTQRSVARGFDVVSLTNEKNPDA